MKGLKFRFNLFFKNKLIIIINLFFCIYLLSMLLTLTNNPTLTFQILFNLIPFYLLISCINGYFIGSLEYQNKCKNLLSTINNSKLKIINEKLLLGILSSLFWFLIQMLIISIIITIHKFNIKDFLSLYISSLHFILGPELIFTIIGVIIGDRFNEKKSFIAIIFIWLIATPLNNILLNYLEVIFDNKNISWYSTIGFMYSNSFDSITGAYNAIYEYSKLIIFIIILIFIYIKIYKKHNIFSYCSLILLLCISSFSLIENKENISDNLEKETRTITWYSQDSSFDLQKDNIFDQYKILDYKADIFPGNESKFLVNLNLELDKESDFLTFMLYNGFKISQIETDTNQSLSFTRSGDLVNIDISKMKSKILKLKFEYSGKSEQHAFINNSGMNLFSRFAYLPTNIIKPAINKYTSTTHDNLGTNSYYHIKVHSKKDVFSNLYESEKNVFTGTSSKGVILISGDNVQTKTIDNVIYYFPKYSNQFHLDIEKNMVTYRNSLQGYINDFLNYFDLEKKIELNKLFLFNKSYILFNDIVDNTFISYLGVTDSSYPKDNFEIILNCLIETDVNSEEELIKKAIFNQAYYEIIYGDFNLETIENNNLYLSLLDTEEKYNTYKQTFNLLSKLTSTERRNFMKNFLNLFKENISFEKLDKLILSYK